MRPSGLDRWRVLVADTKYSSSVSKISGRFDRLNVVCPGEGENRRAVLSGEFDGLVAQSVPVDRDLLTRLTGLRVVLKMGRNYSNVDVDAVRSRGLIFASVPRKGPNCVAELALTLILALSKDLLVSHSNVITGAYRLRGLRPRRTSQQEYAFHWMHNERVHEVRDKTLGIIGMGEIGCELARRAYVLGMRNIYYKRHRLSPELERRFDAKYETLEGLLTTSDYVCLAVPHTRETDKMIGQEKLALMKKDASLINVCRGGVVDEEALIKALTTNRIAGAGLDVFALEPLPADSPLCQMDSVILTPHIGGGTGTSRELELTETLEEMVRILSGERPQIDLS